MSMMGKMSFFLGLQISQSPRGIFINQYKYASKIVKKYGMLSSDFIDTPLIEKSKLDKDLQGKLVDATLYRGMIGSLMYLTSSRSDLTYAVCLCARTSLTAYADADHAGCQDTRRNTSGRAQFLGFLCTAATKVQLLYAATTFNIHEPSTSIIMDTTQAQQKALDNALEPTLQVVLDALKLTPFYKAFEIIADVPEIYMQEFWVTDSIYHTSLHFKINNPPFEKEILSFIRDLGHTGEIKVLSNVNVNHMHQPWRSFTAIINKCLSGKTTGHDSLRLSCAQIIWGMYHNKNVDYVSLLWEDLVYQVENKNSKKNNDMCYPRFTKVIIDYIMKKDMSIPRRNKIFWHTARDYPMFTMIRVISKHQSTQIYSAILPKQLANQAMIEIMDTTLTQQKALDDALVAPANRLKIRKGNLRLIFALKSKEPTLQVVLDIMKLSPFYKAFEITVDISEIYMQEFWVTTFIHHTSLRFKINGKSHTVNVDNFRDMIKHVLILNPLMMKTIENH
uniref:Reverse transcriptase Ty1/copia-type domain-containing protein n=1 Tax=Tanacetum cinerariifolium TaxID=118510 RepID=A0A6L2L1K5_TANCI|nr:hypothetical protein [Tanacetum cinerariifolium]